MFLFLENNQWSLIEIFGYKPPARLDFAYCKIKMPHSNVNIESSLSQLSIENNGNKADEDTKTSELNQENEPNEKNKVSDFFLIHGGMDTEGNIFDDLFFICLS